jgi:hypothetical protein
MTLLNADLMIDLNPDVDREMVATDRQCRIKGVRGPWAVGFVGPPSLSSKTEKAKKKLQLHVNEFYFVTS